MEISAAWIKELVDGGATETETLEFKRTLPLAKNPGAKAEFAKDVTGMANASGGTIIFGLGETEDGCEVVPILEEDFDEAARRLGQMLHSAVEPRELLVRPQRIAWDGGYVLALSVPKSYAGPHRVIADNKSLFYVRSNAHVREFTYNELKDAFVGRGRATEEFRKWRTERLAMIKKGNGARPMPRGLPVSVVHVCALESFERNVTLDPTQFRAEPQRLMFGMSRPTAHSFNLDGIVAYCSKVGDTFEVKDYQYGQLFRTGQLEGVAVSGEFRNGGHNALAAPYIVDRVRKTLHGNTRLLRELGFAGPLVYSFALLGTETFGLPTVGQDYHHADRPDLVLPEIVIPASVDDIDSFARPILDMLWQCFGQPRCPEFDIDTGRYIERFRY